MDFDLLTGFENLATIQTSVSIAPRNVKATRTGWRARPTSRVYPMYHFCTIFSRYQQRTGSFGGGVGLAAGFVRAACRGAIGVVDEDVVVACRAQNTVNRLAELSVLRIERVICLRFRTCHFYWAHLVHRFRISNLAGN